MSTNEELIGRNDVDDIEAILSVTNTDVDEAVHAGRTRARRVRLRNEMLRDGRDELQLGGGQGPRRPPWRGRPCASGGPAQYSRDGRSGDGAAQEHRDLLERLAATDRRAAHSVTPSLLRWRSRGAPLKLLQSRDVV